MPKTNFLAIIVAAVAAFVVGAIWYSPLLFGQPLMELRGLHPDATASTEIPAWKMLVEFVRGLVVAYVLARLVVLLGVRNRKSALQLGILVWIGFPVTLLVGSAIWEDTPWMLCAIHAGDWLVKILLMSLILGRAHRLVVVAHPLPQPPAAGKESPCP